MDRIVRQSQVSSSRQLARYSEMKPIFSNRLICMIFAGQSIKSAALLSINFNLTSISLISSQNLTLTTENNYMYMDKKPDNLHIIKNSLPLNENLIRNNNTDSIIILTLQDHPTAHHEAKPDSDSDQPTQCPLCLSSFHHTKLNPACGHRGCSQRICRDCLSKWYGLNRPGCIINTAALCCPFCRRMPNGRILAKYGMGVGVGVGVGDLLAVTAALEQGREKSEQARWIYAWCRDCGLTRPYIERDCVRDAGSESASIQLRDWSCDNYRDAAGNNGLLAMKVKACPGCGIWTERTSGCHHIKCTICGSDWCYFCGGRFDEGEIYGHMYEMHKGLLDGRDSEDDGYDSDDMDADVDVGVDMPMSISEASKIRS